MCWRYPFGILLRYRLGQGKILARLKLYSITICDLDRRARLELVYVSWDDWTMPKKVGGHSLILLEDAMKGLMSKWIIQTFKSFWNTTWSSCNLPPMVHGVPPPYGYSSHNSLHREGPKFGIMHVTQYERWWQKQLHTSPRRFQKILCNSTFGGRQDTKVYTLASSWVWPIPYTWVD